MKQSKHPPPHQTSCERRSRRSHPTTCSSRAIRACHISCESFLKRTLNATMHSSEARENYTRPALPQRQDQPFQSLRQRELLHALFVLPFVTTLRTFPQDSLRPLRPRAVVPIVPDDTKRCLSPFVIRYRSHS